MNPLFVLIPFHQMGEQKIRAFLHLISVYIKNFGSDPIGTLSIAFDEHDDCVSFALVAVVATQGGDIKTFRQKISKTSQHFHDQ